MPFERQMKLGSPTGALINLYVKPAKASSRAVVQVNHGLAEHALRYARFADFLAERGFHVYAHDHRGHGFTTAPDAPCAERRFARCAKRGASGCYETRSAWSMSELAGSGPPNWRKAPRQ